MLIMSIKSISQSFVWENRQAIIPVTVLAVPIAIELGCFAINLFKDPKIIHKKLSELKSNIKDAFTQRPDEPLIEFRKRFKRNIAITTLAVLAISAAIACPFIVLPTAFAIPAAISAAYAVGKLFLWIQRNPHPIKNCRNYLKDAFKQRPEESLKDFQKRRWKAILQITKCTVAFAATVTALCIAPYLYHALSTASSVWAMADVIPFQSKGIVIAEYLTVGAAHLGVAAYKWCKGEKARALFHLSAAITAVVLPFWHMANSSGPLRPHHSLLGLVLQLAPSQAVRTFGTFIVADSLMYGFSPERGYQRLGRPFVNYDYMNAVYEQFPFVLTSLASVTIAGKALEECHSKNLKS